MVKNNPQTCTCTKYDFQCDYGFIRDTIGNCNEDKNFPDRKRDICKDDQDKEIISKGYKKIPGDKCDLSKTQNKGKLFHQCTVVSASIFWANL